MSSREMDMLTKLLGFESLMDDIDPEVYQGIEKIACRLYRDNPLLHVVSIQDIYELLQSPYFRRMETCLYTIAYYLAECKKITCEENHPPLPSEAFKELEKYLKIICQMEENKRRDVAAIEAISPPLSDAKSYLDDNECKSFQNSLSHAIDAYLDRTESEKLYCPELWLEYSPEYTRWLSIIRSRKEKAANKKSAQVEYEHYMNSVKRLLSEVRSRLATEKPPRFSYQKYITPYMPDQWCELELPAEREVQDWARTKIKEIVPTEVGYFIRWKCNNEILALPSANYEMLGIPCLMWRFTVWLLVTLNLYITGEIVYRQFHGISYPVKMPDEDLGYHYLGPVEWDTLEGLSTPITLLTMLSEGKIEDDGINIIEHDNKITTYEVRGYDGETVEIHDLFRQFVMDVCRGKSLSRGLLAAGMVDKTTASLIENNAMVCPTKKEIIQVEQEENTGNNADVIQALEALGYKDTEAIQMVEKARLHESMSLEERVQAALKTLGS
jgi:hypothetical protein